MPEHAPLIAPAEPDPTGSAEDTSVLDGWTAENRAPARATVYWVVLGLLVIGALLVRGGSPLPWAPYLNLASESFAAALALVLGAFAFVRFHSGRRQTYLFIGTGFIAAGILDASHGFLSSQALFGLAAVEAVDTTAWSWFQSRLFLALFLAISLLTFRDDDPAGVNRVGARSVVRLALSLVAVTVAFFVFVELQGTDAIDAGAFYPRPQELVVGAVFAAAFVGYLIRGEWRTDAFEHWLVVALLISFMSHIAYMGFSAAPGDPADILAHLLKVVSYVALLFGAFTSLYATSTRETHALATIRRINATLQDQVEIRARAEKVLQRSEERLQSFLDGAPDLIQSTDPRGRLIYVNPAWLEALAYGEDDVEDLKLRNVIHPDDRERVIRHFERVLEGERMPRIEVDFLTSDGRVITCSGSVTPYMVDGHASAAQGIFRDVSAQRRAERELAASQANLQAVVESTGDPIWSVDRDQRLVTMNTAFALGVEARTGREPKPGDRVADVFPQAEVEWYREVHDRALGGDRFSEVREEILAGDRRIMEIFGQPVRGAAGVAGAVMFGRDVTRRMMAEEGLRMAKEEAESANRAKSNFLASMSHELRTPLNSVIGFANVLLKNKRGNLEAQDLGFLERILVNGRHLLALINQVLDLAKVEAGRMELDIVEHDLGEIARETVAQLEGQAREKRVALRYDGPDEPVPLRTDASKLRQVLINLVGNAMKFSEGGSVTIRVNVDPHGDPVGIEVEDTGVGIPEDRLQAIFEAFQQADATTAREYGGTGLGLAISRSLCLLMGYDLTAASVEGEGSTFTVVMGSTVRQEDRTPAPGALADGGDGTDSTLEAAAVAIAGAAAQVRGVLDPAGNDLHVLVVEHEDRARSRLARMLDEFGCSVELASSAFEGLDRARTHRPDLVLLDLELPETDGRDVLRTLKEDAGLRDVPVVVMSGRGAHERSRLLGAVDILTKPVAREGLLRLLWRHVVRRRGGRILVVEDDEDTRTLLREHLEGAGLEVAEAENGEDALHAVATDAPDAVLLDLTMPVMDGMTFLEHLRDDLYTRGLPVVVLTARDLTVDEESYLARAASWVIRKGDDVEEELHRVLGAILPLSPTSEAAESSPSAEPGSD